MTDVAGYLRKMATDERLVDHRRALQQSPAMRNVGQYLQDFARPRTVSNLANIPHNLYAIANNALRAGYQGALEHLTGGIALTGQDDARGARGALDAVGAAGMAAGPIGGRALAQVASTPRPARGITAYHGTPHDFDRFDMSRIGTGEGAQHYGHGLYFADNPAVAQSYKARLAPRAIEVDGKRIPIERQDIPYSQQTTEQRAAGALASRAYSRDLNEALDSAIESTDDDAVRALLSSWRQGGAKFSEGRFYEVNIKANKEDFLDWDKPFSQQSEAVKKALRPDRSAMDRVTGRNKPAVDDFVFKDPDNPDPTGSRLYIGAGIDDVGGDKLRSMQRLKEAGIPGIKYLDQGSREGGKGTYNYVVFDEDLIDITQKLGIAVPIPGVPGVVVSEEDFNALQGQG